MMKKTTLFIAIIATTLCFSQSEQQIKKTFSALHGSIECSNSNLDLTTDEPEPVQHATINRTVIASESNKLFVFRMNFSDAVSDDDVDTSIDQMINENTDTGNNFSIVGASKNSISYGTCASTQGNKVMYAVVEFTGTYVDTEVYTAVFNIFSGNDGAGTTLTINTVTLNITVDNTSAGLEDLEKFNFSYAPNPVTDNIRFSSEVAVNHVEVYNLLGQRLLSKKLNRNKQDVDISNLKQGVYVMKVDIEDAVGTFRIIKE